MDNRSRQAIWLALARPIALMIGMGYGCFAFTGVLPLTLNEGLLTLHQGNLVVSTNYAGYLVDALLLARVQPGAVSRLGVISAGLIIANLALLAWVSSLWIITALRAVAGALSAITLIAGLLWLLEHMGHHHGALLPYAGAGLGIFISAEGIVLGHALSFTSQQIWFLRVLCADLLLVLAIRWLLTPPAVLARVPHVETSLPKTGNDMRRAAWRLLMVYGLAGSGYIITAAYLPLFLFDSLQSVDPAHLWALLDLTVASSYLIWYKLALKWGYRQVLTRNLIVQAPGAILPACSALLLLCALNALSVGFTFMGTVTIALSKAKSLSHQVSFNMIAAMIVLYGVGQTVGPLIAGALYRIVASLNPALYAVALTPLIAAGLVSTERRAQLIATLCSSLHYSFRAGAFKPLRQIS